MIYVLCIATALAAVIAILVDVGRLSVYTNYLRTFYLSETKVALAGIALGLASGLI